jgi:hypothetical protein
MAPSQQVTIQATDTALITEELQFDALAVLSRAARFYPDVGSVFLGLKGHRHWPSWVRGPMPPLRAWAEGDASLQEYVNTPSVEFVLFPMTGRIPYPIAHRLPRLPQVRQMAALRRGWSLAWPRYRARIQEAQRARREQPWRVLDVRDMSIGIAKRLDVLVVIPEGMSRTEIAPILEHVTNYVRTQRYRTKENRSYKRKYRKHFARRRPAYVWLQVFTKEKRPSDMWSNRDASFFVCRTEWFDNTYRARGLSPILRLPETVTGTDITVEWSPQYPAPQAEANASI